MADIEITDEQEIPCLTSDVPQICAPSTSIADFALDLVIQARSCLANTPNGAPDNAYTWMDTTPMSRCDEVVVSIMDSRRFTQGKFGDEILNVTQNENGMPIFWQHEFWVTLTRSCSPILNQDGDIVKPSQRQSDSYNFMVDVQTLTCCLEEWMVDENNTICGDGESYYFRPAQYSHVGNSARVSIPLVVGGNGQFACKCCDDFPIIEEVI